MTAVIGILNKTAVAIAADSAMTQVKNGKILNTANKLFTLSKYHPVGVAIYNASAIVGIPWEVLIKEYRRQRGNTYQRLLEIYALDFSAYVKEKVLALSEQPRKQAVIPAASKLFKFINESAAGLANQDLGKLPQNERTLDKFCELASPHIEQIVDAQLAKYTNNNPLIADEAAANYTLEEFIGFYSEPLDRKWQELLGSVNATNELKEKAFSVLFEYFRRENFDLSDAMWSGVGIIGYGDEELYPGCHMLHFAEIVGNFVRVKKKHDESYQITDTAQSAILPFAQRDVMQAFLSGVRPELAQVYYNTFGSLLSGLNAQLAAFTAQLGPLLKDGVSLPPLQVDVNNLVSQLVQQTSAYQQEKIINKIADSIIGLSKEDLAELAESLIHLTYLHRRINSEPESVGGPIDVAVISKGDGFIWIKRKFYFKPEINPGFLQNYFSMQSRST